MVLYLHGHTVDHPRVGLTHGKLTSGQNLCRPVNCTLEERRKELNSKLLKVHAVYEPMSYTGPCQL